MDSNLLTIKEYELFTFISTSQALKAEKILKNEGAEFIIIPTLREISSSCGLAVKIASDFLQDYKTVLLNHNISIEGVYHVVKNEGHNQIRKYD